MGWITKLTRIWLTRSFSPFHFRREGDEKLSYGSCENLGLYVHIPFCKRICSFCPYCKTLFSNKACREYIDALLQEIHQVGSQYPGKRKATSLYFGGGTPALAADRLGEIIEALQEHFMITEGIGAELHPDNVTVPILTAMKKAGITKISIGVQSFQDKYQRMLGRKPVDPEVMSRTLKEVPFETVSMDFIFALPGQTFQDLKRDADLAFSHGANHIAIYPFIDFTFTKSKLSAMEKKRKQKLLEAITKYFEAKGYERNSIWTFSKKQAGGYSSMTRDTFLGFGCSATTLLKRQFKINTFSVEAYCKRIKRGRLPTALTLRFSIRQRMIYYLFWKLYSTCLDAQEFEKFFYIPLNRVYGLEFFLLQCLGFLRKRGNIYKMTLKGAFYYHYYENFYTLSYIDRMWNLMGRQSFPKELKLG